MDVVSEVLRVSGFRGIVGARIEAGRNWAVDLSNYPGMAMHAVLTGDVSVVVVGRPPLQLTAGDVVLLPVRTPHVLVDDRGDGSDALQPASIGMNRGGQALALGSGPTRTRILTVFYDCDHSTRTRVLDEMSGFLHVVGGEVGAAYLDDIVRLLGRELGRPQLATTAVVDALIQILLIQLIRAWVAGRPTDQRGTWLGWVKDPVVRMAIDRIHDAPASSWTSATLASAASVSRATLARRFLAAMGSTPAGYLSQWRMDLAAVRLRDTSDSVEIVAAAVGYQSVPSFARAFVRDRGQTPGAYRLHARDQLRERVVAMAHNVPPDPGLLHQ